MVCVKPATKGSFKSEPGAPGREKARLTPDAIFEKSPGCITLNQCDVWKHHGAAAQMGSGTASCNPGILTERYRKTERLKCKQNP